MNPTAPQNHKPAERIAVTGVRYGEHFVEFSQRHGTRVEKVSTKVYGNGTCAVVRAFTDSHDWLERGELP